MDFDWHNPQFLDAKELIEKTNQSIFFTGIAGTGKSTFLKKLVEIIDKNFIVIAPTGISALNIRGVTIHSFFEFPLRPLLPNDKGIKVFGTGSKKEEIIFNLDTLIIDEISMVRADIMDAIDYSLRKNCRKPRTPFGGKQVIFVGDILQLEPVVVKSSGEDLILKKYYKNFFFFNALVFEKFKFITIELTKVYRQHDIRFIELLNQIRKNTITSKDLNLINRRYSARYNLDKEDFIITLTTTNDIAQERNRLKLSNISAKEYTYKAQVIGQFDQKKYPTDLKLKLRTGAQIIFVKNDPEKQWVNGTIGIISQLSKNKITVKLQDGKEYVIPKQTWENIQYHYDKKSKTIIEEVDGEFIQYPIKLAWAITINKSQGLTFERAFVNFGWGTFLSGQAYVALSRVTHYEGLFLLRKIIKKDIKVNKDLINIFHSFYHTDLGEYLENQIFNNDDERAIVLSIYHHNLAWYYFNIKDYYISLKYLVKSNNNSFSGLISDALFRRIILKVIQRLEFTKIQKSIIIDKEEMKKNRCWWNSLGEDWKDELMLNLGFDEENLNNIKKEINDELIAIAKKIKILNIPGHRSVLDLKPVNSLNNLRILCFENFWWRGKSIHFENLPNLELLQISNCEDLIPMHNMHMCKNLKVLNMPFSVYDKSKYFLKIKKLELVNLYHSAGFGNDQDLFDILNMPSMKKACFCKCWLNKDSFFRFEELPEYNHIEHIDGCGLQGSIEWILVESGIYDFTQIFNED